MKTFLLAFCFVLFSVSASYPLAVNDDAPMFSLRDGKGDFFNLGDYIGPKKKEPARGVVLSFFASYCKPCRNELPVLNSLVDEFERKGIKVVIAGYREDFDKITGMLHELKVDKPVILSDEKGKVGGKYGALGLPFTVFIGSDGRVKDIIRGELPNIEKVLREKAGKLLK